MNKLLLFAFIQLLQIVYITCKCPTIISRREWGAARPKSETTLRVKPPPFVVIHHSDGQNCNSLAGCKSRVLGIQNYHMVNKGWSDIGYNFLVGGDGNVYEGRGWGIFGSHSPRYNARSIGICVLGKFDDQKPPQIQLDAVKSIIECAKERNQITQNYHLLGHRQAGTPTACPGDKLFQEISTWPHFDPNPHPLNA